MPAGRGIVHSERTPRQLRTAGSKLFGIQSWVALAAKDEETAPDFVHYDAGDMPVLLDEGRTVRVIAGSILGASSVTVAKRVAAMRFSLPRRTCL